MASNSRIILALKLLSWMPWLLLPALITWNLFSTLAFFEWEVDMVGHTLVDHVTIPIIPILDAPRVPAITFLIGLIVLCAVWRVRNHKMAGFSYIPTVAAVWWLGIFLLSLESGDIVLTLYPAPLPLWVGFVAFLFSLILIKRYIGDDGRIYLLPDGDDAGDKMAERVLPQLAKEHWTRWLRLPGGNDADSVSKESLHLLLGDVGL